MGNRTRDDARGSDDASPAEGEGRWWYVVANASRGQAYVQRVGGRGYDVAREWDDPGARIAGATDKDREREFQGSVKGETADDPTSLPDLIARELTEAVRRGQVTGIYLVAPAQLLPHLREMLPNDVQPKLVGEHAGDLTQLPRGELFDRLDAFRHAL
jgi:hypothetical protein